MIKGSRDKTRKKELDKKQKYKNDYENYRRKRSEALILPFHSPGNETMVQTGQCSLRGFAQNFVAGISSQWRESFSRCFTHGRRGWRQDGVRGCTRGWLSEAHFVGGRYGAARRHPQRSGCLPQPHIR